MLTQALTTHPLAFVGLILIALWWFRRRPLYKLPPGPPGLPLLGNFLDIPKAQEWLKFEHWGRKYESELIHLRIAGTHIVVVNSTRASRELFDKRSANYSDKVHSVMIHELTGWGRNINFMRYGDEWRAHRRMFHQHFRPDAIPKYHDVMVQAVRRALNMITESPDDFLAHLRLLAGSAVLNVIYGLDLKEKDDPRIETVEEAMAVVSAIATPGAYLVDYLPILKHVPEWVPGAGFKRQARKWKPVVDEMFEGQYRSVKAEHDKDIANPCVLKTILDKVESHDLNEALQDQIINVTGIAYGAGTDTTVSTLSAFILLMATFPDVQSTAQEELDSVVGPNRFPEPEDRGSLPYVSAVLKEVMRLYPILPLATAHQSVSDDEYNGYHIPGGSIVIGNTWAMLHDEDRYKDPYTFDPRRFLTSTGTLDPSASDPIEVFGYSRRICVGRYFALDLIWLALAHILHAFEITKPLDEHGKSIELSGKWTSGLICYPEPFKVTFKARSEQIGRLIRAEDQ